jgi:glutamyl-tRNA reductase
VTALRDHFERVRRDVLADLGQGSRPGQDGLGQGDPALDEVTRRLVNRLLHAPSETLRAFAADNDTAAAQAEELLRRLFEIVPDDRSAEEREK